MPVIEPVVTREKLGELLKEQNESECLDYKTTCNLNDTKQLVEIAKDIGAMSISGGFIIIGADNNGNPSGELAEASARLFDEATLRAKLRKHIPEPFEIRSGYHRIEEKWLALIYIAPHPHGFCIFKADGSYPENGKTRSAFSAGQVFARHGSASEPWRQEDIERIVNNLVSREKEKWRAEIRQELTAIGSSAAAQTLARGPAAMLTWKIDAESFIATIVEQLRNNDTIPLRLLMESVVVDAGQILAHPDLDEMAVLLDRLVCLAALFIVLEEHKWIDRIISLLASIYRLGFDQNGNSLTQPFPGHNLWLMIIERVFALGALAVRRNDWQTVRTLAIQHPSLQENRSNHYPNWVRHALTIGYRQNSFSRSEGGRQLTVSPLSLARNQVRKEKCLRPDFNPEDDGVLDSLCQFDLLGALSAIAAVKDIDGRVWYPCCSHYDSRRTEPIVKRLLSDDGMRKAIFPLDDEYLSNSLRWLDETACKEGWSYFGWDGFSDPSVKDFIAKHASIA
jgi:hypothetical protein